MKCFKKKNDNFNLCNYYADLRVATQKPRQKSKKAGDTNILTCHFLKVLRDNSRRRWSVKRRTVLFSVIT